MGKEKEKANMSKSKHHSKILAAMSLALFVVILLSVEAFSYQRESQVQQPRRIPPILLEFTPEAFFEEFAARKDKAIKEKVAWVLEQSQQGAPVAAVSVAPVNNECSYCGSSAHITAYCAARSIANGAYARFSAPTLGINVAAYFFTWRCPHEIMDEEIAKEQRLVDQWDAASIRLGSPSGTVGGLLQDHNNQVFANLKNITVGTHVYMDFGSFQREYVCKSIQYGMQDSNDMPCDANGVPLPLEDWTTTGGEFICKTCYGGGDGIFLAYFDLVQ